MLCSFLTACARAQPVPLARAFRVFDQCVAGGVKPNPNVYSALLSLCANARSASQVSEPVPCSLAPADSAGGLARSAPSDVSMVTPMCVVNIVLWIVSTAVALMPRCLLRGKCLGRGCWITHEHRRCISHVQLRCRHKG